MLPSKRAATVFLAPITPWLGIASTCKTGFALPKLRLGRNAVFAEGTLLAADHAPLVLEGGPHVLIRTPHLLSPGQMPWVIVNGD